MILEDDDDDDENITTTTNNTTEDYKTTQQPDTGLSWSLISGELVKINLHHQP